MVATTQVQTAQRTERMVQREEQQRPRIGNSVATMTEGMEEIMEEGEIPELPPLREQREERRSRRTVTIEEDIVEEEEHPQRRDSTYQTHSQLEALFDELQEEEEREEARKQNQASQTQRQVVAQVHHSTVLEEEGFEDSFDRFVEEEPQRFRVKRHQNTQRKLTDWSLKVQKKWLILGDSNLTTFPTFFNKDLQIESFPGSHFRHAQALLEKTTPPRDLVVEKVILSFGINGRQNKGETTVKNVQGALRSAKRKFPYAEIWLPLINFSPNLPEEEKENLQMLNDHIERNMPFIPLVPMDRFNTEGDDIHWTAETAETVFDHWVSFLNSNAP